MHHDCRTGGSRPALGHPVRLAAVAAPGGRAGGRWVLTAAARREAAGQRGPPLCSRKSCLGELRRNDDTRAARRRLGTTPDSPNGSPPSGVATCLLPVPRDVRHSPGSDMVDLRFEHRTDRMGDHRLMDAAHDQFDGGDNRVPPHPPPNATAAQLATARTGVAGYPPRGRTNHRPARHVSGTGTLRVVLLPVPASILSTYADRRHHRGG